MGHRVGILALAGSTMYELAVPYEVFGTPRDDLVEGWYTTSFVQGERDGLSAFALAEPRDLSAVSGLGTLVVPPTRPLDVGFPDEILEAIRTAHAGGARVVALCTGAFVVAAAGLLDGREATTHWMYTAQFRARFPEVRLRPDVLYVDSEDVLTSAGKSAAMDLCLYLVKKDYGARVSNEIARRLVAPPHRVGGQAQFMNRAAVGGVIPPLLEQVSAWAAERLELRLGVEDMAQAVHLSSRQLSRLFKTHYQITPRQWLEQQRVFRAQHLLETTDRTVTWVADRAGFGTYASLRRAFRRNLGLTPEAYRQTFFAQDQLATGPPTPPSGRSPGRPVGLGVES